MRSYEGKVVAEKMSTTGVGVATIVGINALVPFEKNYCKLRSNTVFFTQLKHSLKLAPRDLAVWLETTTKGLPPKRSLLHVGSQKSQTFQTLGVTRDFSSR